MNPTSRSRASIPLTLSQARIDSNPQPPGVMEPGQPSAPLRGNKDQGTRVMWALPSRRTRGREPPVVKLGFSRLGTPYVSVPTGGAQLGLAHLTPSVCCARPPCLRPTKHLE